MGERLIRLSHAVGIILLFHCSPCPGRCILKFSRYFINHSFILAVGPGGGGGYYPTKGQRFAAVPSYFNRHLIRCAADSAGPNFHSWADITNCGFENFYWIFPAFFYFIESFINNGFGSLFLTGLHHTI